MSESSVSVLVLLLALGVGAAVPRQGVLARALGGVLGVLFCLGLGFALPDTSGASVSAPESAHLLSTLVALPFLGAVVIVLLPRRLVRPGAVLLLAGEFWISLRLLQTTLTTGWHYQEIHEWIPSLGARIHLAIDGLSFWLLLLTTFLVFVAGLSLLALPSGVRIPDDRSKRVAVALLVLQGALVGAFVSLDLLLFFLFFELTLLPLVFLVTALGGGAKPEAIYPLALHGILSGALLLFAIVLLGVNHQALTGHMSFDYLALSKVMLNQRDSWLGFACMSAAFFVRAAIFPFHGWLRHAHEEAPPAAALLLSGLSLNLGAYGYLRFSLGFFGGPAGEAIVVVANTAIVGGLLYGALLAYRARSPRAAIPYLAMAQMSLVIVGMQSATPAGVGGAVLLMLSSALSIGALVLLFGLLESRISPSGSGSFSELANQLARMPRLLMLLVLSAAAVAGLPGTAGFVGSILVISGTFLSEYLRPFFHFEALLATVGLLLLLLPFLKFARRFFAFSARTEGEANADVALRDLSASEMLPVLLLIGLTFLLGLSPRLILSPLAPTIESHLEHYRGKRLDFMAQMAGADAQMMPRRGGPYERGYPLTPEELAEEEAASQVRDESEPPARASDSPPLGAQPFVLTPASSEAE